MKLIESNIEKLINKKYENNEINTNTNDLNLYYKNQMTNAHGILENKIRKHIIPSSPENKIKINIFCKKKKLKNLLI